MDASVAFSEPTLAPLAATPFKPYGSGGRKAHFNDTEITVTVPSPTSTAAPTAPTSPTSAASTLPPSPNRGAKGGGRAGGASGGADGGGGEGEGGGGGGDEPHNPAEKPGWADETRIETLRHDLAEAHNLIRSSLADAQAVRLTDRIISLEADIRAIQQDAELWRHKYLEMERDRVIAAAAEDRTLVELRESRDRERQLAAKGVQLRLEQADAVRTHQQAEEEIRAQLAVLRKQDESLRAKDEELEHLKAQLFVARRQNAERGGVSVEELGAALRTRDAERARREASEKAHVEEINLTRTKHAEIARQVQERIEALEAQLAESSKSRVQANLQAADLRSQNKQLEEAVSKLKLEARAGSQAAALRARNEHLEEVVSKLRMDLQGDLAIKDEIKRVRARNDHLEELTKQLRLDLQRHVDSSDQLRAFSTRNEQLEQRIRELQLDLQARNEEQTQAKFFRARADELEETNKQLKIDLQDALSQWAHLGVPLGASTVRERNRALGCDDEGLDAGLSSTWPRPPPPQPLAKVAPVPHFPPKTMSRLDALRGARSRQLRREVLTARASAAVDAVTRPAPLGAPRSSSRTEAFERYDGDGRLVSWDATGRPV